MEKLLSKLIEIVRELAVVWFAHRSGKKEEELNNHEKMVKTIQDNNRALRNFKSNPAYRERVRAGSIRTKKTDNK